jgi:hypothetical protein
MARIPRPAILGHVNDSSAARGVEGHTVAEDPASMPRRCINALFPTATRFLHRTNDA